MTASTQQGQVVVFNYPSPMRLHKLISELRAQNPELKFTLVDARLAEIPEEFARLGVHFVRGDVIDDETFVRANVVEAMSCVVFPENFESRESDLKTSFTIGRLAQLKGRNTRVIHFVVDPSNEHLFNGHGSTPIFSALSVLAAVQEINDPGTALGIERLLLNSRGEDPHTITPSTAFCSAGVTWEKLLIHGLRAARVIGTNVNFQCLIRDGVPNYCPDPDTVVTPGDKISVVARHKEPLNWPALEQEILHYM